MNRAQSPVNSRPVWHEAQIVKAVEAKTWKGFIACGEPFQKPATSSLERSCCHNLASVPVTGWHPLHETQKGLIAIQGESYRLKDKRKAGLLQAKAAKEAKAIS